MRLPALLVLLALLLPLASHAQSPSAQQAVQENSARVMGEMEARRAEFQADPVALHAFTSANMDRLVDQDRLARLALGPAARSATPEELAAFGRALSRNLAARYGDALLEFDGTVPLVVVSSKQLPKDRGVQVSTSAMKLNGKKVDVDYLLRATQGSWRVFDVQIEGFSYAMSIRSLFAEDMRKLTVAQLAEDLEKRTDRMIKHQVAKAAKPLSAPKPVSRAR